MLISVVQNTFIVVNDGTPGEPGAPGIGYTASLSKDSYTFAGGTSSALAGSTFTNVTAYKNTTQIATTITKIGTVSVSGNQSGIATGITGLTASVSGNGTTACKITFNATTALTTKNGSIAIVILADGQNFIKEFSFAISFKGDTGGQGKPGDPTGITESATEPTTKYTGMLWKHTGSIAGLLKDATYIWNGTKWTLFYFSAANIDIENLSAISANLGTVTAGEVKLDWEVYTQGIQKTIGTTNLSEEGAASAPIAIEHKTLNLVDDTVISSGKAEFWHNMMIIDNTRLGVRKSTSVLPGEISFTKDGYPPESIDHDFISKQREINRNMQNKIVFGGTKDCIMIATDQNLTFTSGAATFNAAPIASAYGKTVGSAIAHIKIASSTVITSTSVDANGVVTTRAYNMSANAGFSGIIGCIIYIILK